MTFKKARGLDVAPRFKEQLRIMCARTVYAGRSYSFGEDALLFELGFALFLEGQRGFLVIGQFKGDLFQRH